MKKIIRLFIATLILTSCSEKALYDCGCQALLNYEEGKLKGSYTAGGQTGYIKTEDGIKPFTGTCAIVTDDRAKEIIGLYTFQNGYRTKSISYEMLDTVKFQTKEITYDEKDVATGWEKKYEIVGNENVQTYEVIYDSKNAPTGWERKYEMAGIEKIQTKDMKFVGDKKDGWQLSIRATPDLAHVESYEEYENGDKNYSYELDFESSLDIFYTSGGPSTSFVKLDGAALDEKGGKKRLCITEFQYYSGTIEEKLGFLKCIESENLRGFLYKYYPNK